MRPETVHRKPIEVFARDALLRAKSIHGVLGKQGYIFSTCAKWGQSYAEDVQPVKEVFPEQPFLHTPGKVYISCRNDPHVESDAFVSPQSFDLALLYDTKNLACGCQRHITDFIKEEVPRFAASKLTGPRLNSAR